MTLNQRSKVFGDKLLKTVIDSGLPLAMCELHIRNLLNIIQNTMRQEDELEAQKEKEKETQEAKAATEEIKPAVEKD